MKVRDVMTTQVAALHPLTEAVEAARFLSERRISGAPVVDQHGNLVGVVSQTDLVRLQGRASAEGWPGQAVEPEWLGDAARAPVFTLMTTKPVTCDEETPLEDVAVLMLERRIHRVLVTSEGKLAGIVTAMDLLRAIPASTEGRWERE
jgi:CBS domain-containing protein